MNTAERVPITTLARPEAAGPPGLEPRAVCERGVQGDDGCREPCAEARDELGRQRDLGHEHERAAARLEHALDEPKVDLGLSAAGDAVEEPGAEFPERCADLLDGGALVRGQYRARAPGSCGRRGLRPGNGFEPAAFHKRAHGGRVPRGRDGRSGGAVAADEIDEG